MMVRCDPLIFVVVQVFGCCKRVSTVFGAIWQIYFEWFGRNTFVINLRIVHDEYCCRASVGNGFICSNGQRI